jgi:hypothetical protein
VEQVRKSEFVMKGKIAMDGANLKIPGIKTVRVGDGAHIKTPPKPASKPAK